MNINVNHYSFLTMFPYSLLTMLPYSLLKYLVPLGVIILNLKSNLRKFWEQVNGKTILGWYFRFAFYSAFGVSMTFVINYLLEQDYSRLLGSLILFPIIFSMCFVFSLFFCFLLPILTFSDVPSYMVLGVFSIVSVIVAYFPTEQVFSRSSWREYERNRSKVRDYRGMLVGSQLSLSQLEFMEEELLHEKYGDGKAVWSVRSQIGAKIKLLERIHLTFDSSYTRFFFNSFILGVSNGELETILDLFTQIETQAEKVLVEFLEKNIQPTIIDMFYIGVSKRDIYYIRKFLQTKPVFHWEYIDHDLISLLDHDSKKVLPLFFGGFDPKLSDYFQVGFGLHQAIILDAFLNSVVELETIPDHLKDYNLSLFDSHYTRLLRDQEKSPDIYSCMKTLDEGIFTAHYTILLSQDQYFIDSLLPDFEWGSIAGYVTQDTTAHSILKMKRKENLELDFMTVFERLTDKTGLEVLAGLKYLEFIDQEITQEVLSQIKEEAWRTVDKYTLGFVQATRDNPNPSLLTLISIIRAPLWVLKLIPHFLTGLASNTIKISRSDGLYEDTDLIASIRGRTNEGWELTELMVLASSNAIRVIEAMDFIKFLNSSSYSLIELTNNNQIEISARKILIQLYNNPNIDLMDCVGSEVQTYTELKQVMDYLLLLSKKNFSFDKFSRDELLPIEVNARIIVTQLRSGGIKRFDLAELMVKTSLSPSEALVATRYLENEIEQKSLLQVREYQFSIDGIIVKTTQNPIHSDVGMISTKGKSLIITTNTAGDDASLLEAIDALILLYEDVDKSKKQ